MTTKFTFLEKQLIRSSLATKTDGEIAALLERPIEEIEEVINEITGGKAAERSEKIAFERKVQYEAARLKTDAAEKAKQDKEAARLKREKLAEERRNKKLQEQLKKEQRNKEKQARLNMEEKMVAARNARDRRDRFKTRDLQLDKLISVRIDHKTIVLVKPGANIEKIKAQYKRELTPQSFN